MTDDIVTTSLILALVALSDGVRRIPAGAIVLRRLGLGPWTAPRFEEPESRLELVSWCIPLALPLVLTRESNGTSGPESAELALTRRLTRFRARLRRVRHHVLALRINGLAILATLVVVLPLLAYRGGAWGFLVGVQLLLTLCLVQVVAAAMALRRVGIALRPALFASVPFAWPFTAPRAAEVVQSHAVAGLPPLLALHELAPEDEFLRVARPALYDAMVRNIVSDDVAALAELWGEARVRSLIGKPSAEDADLYCPRCGSAFNPGREFCTDCGDVALLPRAGVVSPIATS
ncbi:MAG: hypothetical protein WD825_11525 [Gemmatimonadaceae bacterium]